MEKRVQAKDVPEDVILNYLRERPGRWHTHWRDDFRPHWSMTSACPALAAFPEKVLRAKLASMKRRGLIDGCECGCRGDWHVPEEQQS